MKTINLLLYVMRQLHEARQVVAYLTQKPESEVNLNADLNALYDCIVNLTTDNGMANLKCEKLQTELRYTIDQLRPLADFCVNVVEAGDEPTPMTDMVYQLVTAYDETGSISRVMNGVR